jgi:ubiquinone biosynthesis protein UbiJ
MLKEPLLKALNAALQTYLNADPHSKDRLRKLHGKAFALKLHPFDFTLYGECTQHSIHLSTEAPTPIQTTISGTPLQLAALAFTKSNARHRFFADDITLEGNAEFAQQLMHVFDALSIDWEEIISHCLGDGPAYRLSQAVVFAKNSLKQGIKSLIRNTDDYLHEECELAPHPFALEDFMNDVDELSMNTERLSARIHHLSATLTDEAPHETP